MKFAAAFMTLLLLFGCTTNTVSVVLDSDLVETLSGWVSFYDAGDIKIGHETFRIGLLKSTRVHVPQGSTKMTYEIDSSGGYEKDITFPSEGDTWENAVPVSKKLVITVREKLTIVVTTVEGRTTISWNPQDDASAYLIYLYDGLEQVRAYLAPATLSSIEVGEGEAPLPTLDTIPPQVDRLYSRGLVQARKVNSLHVIALGKKGNEYRTLTTGDILADFSVTEVR